MSAAADARARGAAEEPEPEPGPAPNSSSSAAPASYDPRDYQPLHPDDRDADGDGKALKGGKGKGKGKGESDAHRCGNCDAPDAKTKCTGCGVEYYCNDECQTEHWKYGGHKSACPAYVLAAAAHAQQKRECKAAFEADQCLICLEPPREPTMLPCGHSFCTACVVELRSKGVSETCPLCRSPLPPGPEKLYELGYRVWVKLNRTAAESGRHDGKWRALSASQQSEMDGAIVMVQEAMDQGHIKAAGVIGNIYFWGQGTAIDFPRATAAYKVGAEGGDVVSQHQLGCMYASGHDAIDVDYAQARPLFEKAAAQDWPEAVCCLGTMYDVGHGVTPSWRRAREYFRRAIGLGNSLAVEKMQMLSDDIRKVAPLMDKRVEIHGTSRADMNGKRGVAVDFHKMSPTEPLTWRYMVKLDGGEAFKIKPASLRAKGKGRGKKGRSGRK